eukprot:107155-Ditylum_brightwellii.AAC.1
MVKLLTDKTKVALILQENIDIFFVSDRGTTDGLGYFGWVVETHIEVLVQYKGYTADNPDLIKSLQTESIRALLLLRFTHQFCNYHKTPINTTAKSLPFFCAASETSLQYNRA